MYIGDISNHRVRLVNAGTTIISTIAGTGTNGFSGDGGSATSAALNRPIGVAIDASGNVFVGDCNNYRIRKIIALTSDIYTIAGTGVAGYSGDGGQATAADIKFPHGVNLDTEGNVYFGDISAYNVIRKITVSTGIISTVAGTGSTSGGYNGDNIQATAATLFGPHDVVLDSYNNLYISDRANNRVRKVDVSTGIITTVVGNGSYSSTGDGYAATSATIYGPCFSRFDSAGNYYITEFYGNRVRKVITVSTEIPTVIPSMTPTLYPTLPPSSHPTSHPTKMSIIEANLLDLESPLTSKVVQDKTNYYLGAFVAYFLSIYLCLYLFSFTKIGKATAYSLYNSSYDSKFYATFCDTSVATSEMRILRDISKKMQRVVDAMRLEKELQLIEASIRGNMSVKDVTSQSHKLLDLMILSSAEGEYSKGYRKYMSQKFTLLSC